MLWFAVMLEISVLYSFVQTRNSCSINGTFINQVFCSACILVLTVCPYLCHFSSVNTPHTSKILSTYGHCVAPLNQPCSGLGPFPNI